MPIIVGDDVVGVFAIAEDVTRHNLMQAALDEARRTAEEASTATSLFLATMSHEIRTPLTSMLAAVKMLDFEDLEPSQRHLTEIMDRQGRALLRMVEEIVDFSRIEAGVIDLERIDLDLGDLLEEVMSLHSPCCRQGAGAERAGGAGIGVSAEQQADSSIIRRFGGTGLGLAICRQLVTAMAGTIELRSTPGEGNALTVTAPREHRLAESA